MKDSLTLLLSGIGFYKLSKQRQRMLAIVLGVSLAAHVVAMLIFGSMVFFEAIQREKTVFISTPPLKTYEPRKLELKVKVQKQQRSSSRPSMIPRMVSARVNTSLVLPEIKVDPKVIKTSFQPKFKAVTGSGLGVGLGTGYGLGGFGTGVSQFDFFGIRGKGERIAILVDVSVSMVEEDHGGFDGVRRVRARIEKVLDALNAGSMFNVLVFADACSAFQTNMVVATDDHKTKAKQFLRPFNSSVSSVGLTSGNYSPGNIGLPSAGGTTRLDMALTAAFEQGADTVLVISDGIPRVRKVMTADAMRNYQQTAQNWNQQNAGRVAAWQTAFQAAEAEVAVSSERVWIPPTPGMAARPPGKTPLKEGVPPDRGSPAVPPQPGRWEVRTARHGGYSGPPRPAPPPMPEPGWWNLTDFIEHLKIVHEKLYVAKGKKLPAIHAIGYVIDKEGSEFLQGLAEHYKGRYRRVSKID